MATKINAKARSSNPSAATPESECPALSPTAQSFVDAASHVLHRWDGRTELTALENAAFRLCRSCPPDLLHEFDACMRLQGNAMLDGIARLRVKLLPRKPLLAFVLA